MKPARRSVIAALCAGALAAPTLHAQTALFERFVYEGHDPASAKPGPGEFHNPVLAGYYPDPSVTRVGEDYYLVNSSFAHFPGLPVFHSRNLVDWVQIGNAISRPGQLDFSGRQVSEAIFAPDISFHDGTFYIVTTCVGCKGNFVMTSHDPAGPWSAPTWLPFEGIDPSIYWEADRAFIVNNRAPAGGPRYDGHRAIWLQEFDWRAGKMVGESTQLVDGGVDITQKPSWIEGPHIFKRDGFYYLTAAEGGTGPRHSEVIFRARNVRGPYEPYAGNPILTQRDLPKVRPHPVTSAGHAKLVETQTGAWWATFLATRPYRGDDSNIGRETFLLPVSWRDGWPVILHHGKSIPLINPRPRLPADLGRKRPTNGPFADAEEFEGAALGPQWIGIRTPKSPIYAIRQGALILDPGAPLGDLASAPTFIGRRQQHHDFSVSTTMRYAPATEGARAGLAAVQNDRSFVFFGITLAGGKTVVALTVRDKADRDTIIATAPVTTSAPVTLTIRQRGAAMAFEFAANGRRHTLRRDFDAGLLSTRRAGGFVGTVIGLYNSAR